MRDGDSDVAGVRFRNAGKIFYFDTAGMRLEPGEFVVVETTRGPEIAKVVIAPDQVVVNELGREELKPILRLATEDDIRRADELQQEAAELLPEARRLAEEAGFPARIDSAEYTLDGKRLTFSFTSEERLDYREFLKRAGDRFGARVDMRLLGARDRAKLAGGYGICGRELCCASWLATFPSISIRMAKEQELPLNPQKISGLCGRLLCCLSYEEEGYKEMRKSLPKLGQRCSTPTGEGKVIAVNILQRRVTLVIDGQRIDVTDRDLGTVVRWDPTSKAAPPPPSISRAEAIEQGLIEATAEDLREAEIQAQPADWITEGGTPAAPHGAGRGRLPGGGPRKQARPRTEPARGGPTPEPRRGQPRRERPPGQRPSAGPPEQAPEPPRGRVFQRSQPPPPGVRAPAPTPKPSPPANGEGGSGGGGRRRRGRRGGRGRNGPGAEG